MKLTMYTSGYQPWPGELLTHTKTSASRKMGYRYFFLFFWLSSIKKPWTSYRKQTEDDSEKWKSKGRPAPLWISLESRTQRITQHQFPWVFTWPNIFWDFELKKLATQNTKGHRRKKNSHSISLQCLDKNTGKAQSREIENLQTMTALQQINTTEKHRSPATILTSKGWEGSQDFYPCQATHGDPSLLSPLGWCPYSPQ